MIPYNLLGQAQEFLPPETTSDNTFGYLAAVTIITVAALVGLRSYTSDPNYKRRKEQRRIEKESLLEKQASKQ